MTENSLSLAYARFASAEDAWDVALEAEFGNDAGDARYYPRGQGQPGTDLSAAYAEWNAARLNYEAELGAARAA